MRALDRRLARLETMSQHVEGLVDPETLQRMAQIEAERARIREKLLSDGPHEPAVDRAHGDSDARRSLRDKLLRDDAPPAESARA